MTFPGGFGMNRSRSALQKPHSQRAFTLIEILVAIAVIAVLIALLVPAVQQARMAARRTQCLDHLHQLALGLHNYHEAHRILPPGSIVLGPGSDVYSGWGWGAMLLPLLDQGPLHSQIDFNLGTAVGTNLPLLQERIPLWRCPSDPADQTVSVALGSYPMVTVATGNYAGNTLMLGPLSSVRFAHVTDGLSQTLLLGERVTQVPAPGDQAYTAAWSGMISQTDMYVFNAMPYTAAVASFPINAHLSGTSNFSSLHSGGSQFAFGDGAVRFLSESIDGTVYEALGTPGGAEVVDY